jgi:hypothetical protein
MLGFLSASNGWSGNAVSGASGSVPSKFEKGDAVQLQAFPDTVNFIRGIYPIDDRGCALLPIAGEVRVDTMSVRGLEKYLDSLYLPFLRYADVQARPLMRLTFIGGFIRPGLYYVSPNGSLWDAMALAGGPLREDGLNKICWERNGACLRKGLVPLVASGQSLAAAGVLSGDVFTVTPVPKRTGWEIFTTGVLPIFGIAITAASAAATVYFSYQLYKVER